MSVQAVVGHVTLAVGEPPVEEFVRRVYDSFRVLKPVNVLGQLTPKSVSILD